MFSPSFLHATVHLRCVFSLGQSCYESCTNYCHRVSNTLLVTACVVYTMCTVLEKDPVGLKIVEKMKMLKTWFCTFYASLEAVPYLVQQLNQNQNRWMSLELQREKQRDVLKNCWFVPRVTFEADQLDQGPTMQNMMLSYTLCCYSFRWAATTHMKGSNINSF